MFPPRLSKMSLKNFLRKSMWKNKRKLEIADNILKGIYFPDFFIPRIICLYIISKTAGTHTKPLILYSTKFFPISLMLSAKQSLKPIK